MKLEVILVVLLAASFHAAWNATVKSEKDTLLAVTGINLAGVVIGVFALPFVGLPDSISWPYLIVSAFLHCGYYFFLSEAFRYGDFSEAYPVARGTAPVLVVLMESGILGYAMTAIQLIAFTGIFLGLFIFTWRSLNAALSNKKALIAALVTSVFIAVYTVVDGIGGRLSGNVPAYLVWLTLCDGLLFVLYAVTRQGISGVSDIFPRWKKFFFGSLLSIVSYTMVIWSMTQAPIALVSALRETSIIIAALIGMFYFKEPSGYRRIMASLVIFSSVALLAFD